MDNLAKLILDAMTKAGATGMDDNQVCDLRITKYDGPIGGLAVTVEDYEIGKKSSKIPSNDTKKIKHG